jgi:hypothetical protein
MMHGTMKIKDRKGFLPYFQPKQGRKCTSEITIIYMYGQAGPISIFETND